MRRSLAGGLLPRRMWRWSGLWLVVCVGITTAQRPLSAAEIRAIETQPPPPPSPPEPPAPPPTPRVRAEGELKLLLVQALFRHGDRTPYSPLRDKHFWETTLPDAEDIAEISSLTIPLRSSSEPNCHPAAGNGPFGSLTIKGIAQMEARGELLRDALVHSKGEARRERDARWQQLPTRELRSGEHCGMVDGFPADDPECTGASLRPLPPRDTTRTHDTHRYSKYG